MEEHHTQPEQQTTPRSRATHRAYVAWVAAGYDVWDYERLEGPFRRRDWNEQAELAINAGAERWRYQKRLTGKMLLRHRDRKIIIRSAPVKTGVVRLRLDADEHQGQTDARQAIEWIAANYFLNLYHEPSERGHAGYLDVELPRLPWHGAESPNGDGTYYEAAGKINTRIDAMQASLVKMLKAAGFQCTFEINGRFQLRSSNGDGTRKILNRGGTAKLPRCFADDDVERLTASRGSWSVIEQITRDGELLGTAPARPQAASPEPVPTLRSYAKRSRRGKLKIANTDDKNLNRWICCREAALPSLGTVSAWSDLPDDTQAQLIDAANALYVSNGFASGERDRARDASFRQKFKRLFDTYDPRMRGQSCSNGTWFDELEDVRAAEKLLRSKVSKKQLAELRETHGLRGAITYWTLAFTLVVVAKNANTACGMYNVADVPVKSVIALLSHFGISVNGTFARIAFELFEELGLLSVGKSYWAGHFARRMTVTGKARSLPFIRNVYEAQLRYEADQRASRLAERRGQLRSSGLESNTSLWQCILGEPYTMSLTLPTEETAYWSNLADLESEYAERSILSAA